jgi:hypothetical protein
MTESGLVVFAAVEGMLDEIVLRRLLADVGVEPAAVYGKQGKQHLRERVPDYNHAARHSRWVVLVDLNTDEECAPLLREQWLADPAAGMCFRVAVHEVESWLIADRVALSRFLGVPRTRLPVMPDDELDPKRTIVSIARSSRYNGILEDMVPRPGSGRPVGPAYTSRLAEFASMNWRPEVAADASESLRRCLARLGELATHMKAGDSAG